MDSLVVDVKSARQLLVDVDKESDRRVLDAYRLHSHVLKRRFIDPIINDVSGRYAVTSNSPVLMRFRDQIVSLLETELEVLTEGIANLREKHSLQPLEEKAIEDESDEVEPNEKKIDANSNSNVDVVDELSLVTVEKEIETLHHNIESLAAQIQVATDNEDYETVCKVNLYINISLL